MMGSRVGRVLLRYIAVYLFASFPLDTSFASEFGKEVEVSVTSTKGVKTSFVIPNEFSSLQLKEPKDFGTGPIVFHVWLTEMQPYWPKIQAMKREGLTRKEYYPKSVQNRLEIHILSSPGKGYLIRRRNKNVLPPQADIEFEEVFGGLKFLGGAISAKRFQGGRSFELESGGDVIERASPYYWYLPNQNTIDTNVAYIFCSSKFPKKPTKFGRCTALSTFSADAYLKYTFSMSQIDHWAQLDERVHQLVSSFETNQHHPSN